MEHVRSVIIVRIHAHGLVQGVTGGKPGADAEDRFVNVQQFPFSRIGGLDVHIGHIDGGRAETYQDGQNQTQ